MTLRVLEEIGIETAGLRSKDVAEFLGKVPLQYVIVVCDHAQQSCPRVFPGVVERLFWPFDDPPATPCTEAEQLPKFRQVRDQIDARVRDWIADLEAEEKLERPANHANRRE